MQVRQFKPIFWEVVPENQRQDTSIIIPTKVQTAIKDLVRPFVDPSKNNFVGHVEGVLGAVDVMGDGFIVNAINKAKPPRSIFDGLDRER